MILQLCARSLLRLSTSDRDLEVVGEAPDAHVARELIKTLTPDVLTLDVQMPRMDGLEFLGRLMRLRPMRVVMVSAFTLAGSETTLRALELGAVDFVSKPRANSLAVLEKYAEEVIDKIRAAAMARLPALQQSPQNSCSPVAGRRPVSVYGGNRSGCVCWCVYWGTEAHQDPVVRRFLRTAHLP